MDAFGKYRVREQIGAGSFGDVFKGFDPTIRRNVAIKTCSTTGEEARLRFRREAEISGNLSHPNIVTLYDFGFEGDIAYLVQEFLAGEDLDDAIARDAEIALARKLDYLTQIARGLAYAHSKDVIHRDVKPGNVRVLPDGSVKLLDFGIAKLVHEESALTSTGMTLGTAAYVAPEQILGKQLDARCDVFSYGVLAYELLAYQRPFRAKSSIDVLHQIVESSPEPLPLILPDCSVPVWKLVARCLEKARDDRFQSFEDVISRLEELR